MGYFTQRRINLHKTQLISLSHTHEHSDAFILNSLPIIQVLRHLFPGSLSRVVCSEWRTTKSTFETLAAFYGFSSVCYQFGMCLVMPMRSWQWLISSSWPTSVSHWDLVSLCSRAACQEKLQEVVCCDLDDLLLWVLAANTIWHLFFFWCFVPVPSHSALIHISINIFFSTICHSCRTFLGLCFLIHHRCVGTCWQEEVIATSYNA